MCHAISLLLTLAVVPAKHAFAASLTGRCTAPSLSSLAAMPGNYGSPPQTSCLGDVDSLATARY